MTDTGGRTNTGDNPYLERAYGLTGVDEARRLYDEWADRFDADVTGPAQGYVAPRLTARTVARVAGLGGTVLDAGCGTGLVGAELAAAGARTVDGVDLSPGMLARARETGAYRHLEVADLSHPLPVPADTYDVLVCVGTLTHGHVGPGAFGEFARLVRPGGYVVATVLDDIWESGGYRAEVERLDAMGVVQLREAELVDYRAAAGVSARMVVLAVR